MFIGALCQLQKAKMNIHIYTEKYCIQFINYSTVSITQIFRIVKYVTNKIAYIIYITSFPRKVKKKNIKNINDDMSPCYLLYIKGRFIPGTCALYTALLVIYICAYTVEHS